MPSAPVSPLPDQSPWAKKRVAHPWWRRGWLVLAVLFLTVWFFSPVAQVAGVQLDESNYASYAYFTAKYFQFGTDVMPMAGPYGFVPYGFSYSGHLFSKRFPLELLTKAVLAGLIVWFVRRTPQRPILTASWLLAMLLLTPLITDLPYAFAILLSGLCLVECHVTTDRRRLLVACGLAAYLALLTLFKGTQSMLACATLGLLCLQAIMLRDFRRLPWIVGTYIFALAVWLAFAGQNPLNLPRYLAGMIDISSGYNLAMGVQEPAAHFATGVAAAGGLLLLLALALWPTNWKHPRVLGGSLYLAGFTFVLWKHGFVRADGHVAIFYHYALIAVPMFLLFTAGCGGVATGRLHRTGLGALAVFTLAAALWGDGAAARVRFASLWDRFPGHMREVVQQVLNPTETKRRFDAELERYRAYYRLARVQERVGQAPIDFFGVEQGFLLLNRLNYRPRPVGGGTFSVFTAKLQARNEAWLNHTANHPEYFLVNVSAIDERLAALEDAATLRFLLTNYAPIEIVMGLPLFHRRPDASAAKPLQPLGTRPLRWNEPVVSPAVGQDEILYATFSFPPSLRGRIQTFLYKPPYVLMDLQGTGIELPQNRKIIPSMVTTPVPVSPLIESTDDLLKLYQGESGKAVNSFMLTTNQPGFFNLTGMQVHFFSGPRPAVQPPPPASSRHPWVSDIEPQFIDATLAPVHRFDGMVAQMLVPPGRMGFVLRGDENEVEFIYGMEPVTYTLPSDGVDIGVTLDRPGQPSQILFKRNLKPQLHPADQGAQPGRVTLPPSPTGSILWLTTGRGPDNDGAWDLAYFTRVTLNRGPYLPELFPRFARVPAAVSAGANGPIPFGDRDIYMLNAPGRLEFALQGDERKVHLGFGILPGAYQNGGNTDGVEFRVSLLRPDGTEQVLATWLLEPVNQPSDQGDQLETLSLPPLESGSKLILATLAGPQGDYAWDWSYIESLRFE